MNADTLRRAARVQRTRTTDAPSPTTAVRMADWLDEFAALWEADGGEAPGQFADADAAFAVAESILAETCGRPLPASAVGSVCGRLHGHNSGCGAPIAAMPGIPVRTGTGGAS